MPVVSNGLYSHPDMGAIVSNLGTAIWGNPEARMKRDYYDAQSAEARARAGKADEETNGLRIKNGAYADLPSIAAAFAPLPNETAEQHAARIAPVLGRLAQAGGGNASEMANGFNTGLGTVFSLGNDDDMRRSLVMGGKIPGKDFAGTAQRADEVQARDAADERKTKYGVANIEQSGATARENIQENGRNNRFYGGPLNVTRGTDVYIAPNDPRYGKVGGKDGVIHGAPTLDSLRADAGRQILDLPADQQPNSNVASVFSGGVPGYSKGDKPHAVTGKALNDAVAAAASMVKGAATLANGKTAVDAKFESSFDPADVATARQAAGEELGRSGNVQLAAQAYLHALNVQPGAELQKPGLGARIWGHLPLTDVPRAQVVDPAAPKAPVAAAPAAPAAPAQAAPVATPAQIPPPAQRPVGMKVQSPRGEVEWTGTGWRPTSAGKVY